MTREYVYWVHRNGGNGEDVRGDGGDVQTMAALRSRFFGLFQDFLLSCDISMHSELFSSILSTTVTHGNGCRAQRNTGNGNYVRDGRGDVQTVAVLRSRIFGLFQDFLGPPVRYLPLVVNSLGFHLCV